MTCSFGAAYLFGAETDGKALPFLCLGPGEGKIHRSVFGLRGLGAARVVPWCPAIRFATWLPRSLPSRLSRGPGERGNHLPVRGHMSTCGLLPVVTS